MRMPLAHLRILASTPSALVSSCRGRQLSEICLSRLTPDRLCQNPANS